MHVLVCGCVCVRARACMSMSCSSFETVYYIYLFIYFAPTIILLYRVVFVDSIFLCVRERKFNQKQSRGVRRINAVSRLVNRPQVSGQSLVQML